MSAGIVIVVNCSLAAAGLSRNVTHASLAELGVALPGMLAAAFLLQGFPEELFFRGAIFSAIPGRWAIPASTALYATSTLLSGVLLLTFAAICLGLLTAAQRRVTGGVLGPITSHLTWSLGMLFLLPHVLTLGV